MKIGAQGLPNSSTCFCSDNNPFFEIFRGQPGPSQFKVYSSDPAQGTVNPTYSFFKLSG